MNKVNVRGFTLIEIVMVVVVMGIVLSMTIVFGSNYLKELQLRKEKEGLLNSINYATSYSKSTNYYQGEKFETLAVSLGNTGVTILLNGLTGAELSSYTLNRAEMTGLSSNYVMLFPYQRGCFDEQNQTATGRVEFSVQSTVNENRFCFERDMELCKILSVICP